jgi:hypothetical protein
VVQCWWGWFSTGWLAIIFSNKIENEEIDWIISSLSAYRSAGIPWKLREILRVDKTATTNPELTLAEHQEPPFFACLQYLNTAS